jgi:hypothetical protein
MSASKFGASNAFKPFTVESGELQVSLPASAVHIHKNGIEFRAGQPIPIWNEMTVSLVSPGDPKRLKFNGVVVACSGNKHGGYVISMVFTSVSRSSQERLANMAQSRLA